MQILGAEEDKPVRKGHTEAQKGRFKGNTTLCVIMNELTTPEERNDSEVDTDHLLERPEMYKR